MVLVPGALHFDDSIEESGREALVSVGNDDSIEDSAREAPEVSGFRV